MASLKLVRSPISRVSFDSWFQAIAPRYMKYEIYIYIYIYICMKYEENNLKIITR